MESEKVQDIIDEVATRYEIDLGMDEVLAVENFSPEIIEGLAVAAAKRKSGTDLDEEEIDFSRMSSDELMRMAVANLKKQYATPQGVAETRMRRRKGASHE